MTTVKCQSCGFDNSPQAQFCANCGSKFVTAMEQPAPALVIGAGPATS